MLCCVVLLAAVAAAASGQLLPPRRTIFADLPAIESEIVGITSCGGVVAVASRENVHIYEQTGGIGREIGMVSLPHEIDRASGLLAFSCFDHFEFGYCDANACRLCSLSPEPRTAACVRLQTPLDGRDAIRIKSASLAAAANRKLFVRVVDDRDNAAIFSYNIEAMRASEVASPDQLADDVRYIGDHFTSSAFTKGPFAYFIGSAFQPYEPLINADLGTENRTIVKITRVCAGDATASLESRIDLALTCKGLVGFDWVNTASHYSPDSDVLTVAYARPSDPKSPDVLCEFRGDEVAQELNRVWHTCQNTSFVDSNRNCLNARDEADLPESCYIFTRNADGHRMKTCARFGLGDQLYDNCMLDGLRTSGYRYGWLESFRALEGRPLLRLDTGQTAIREIIPDTKTDSVFYSTTDHILHRASESPQGNRSAVVWHKAVMGAERFPAVISHEKTSLLYVDGRRVRNLPISCHTLYESCLDIANGGSNDAMGCLWCADKDGSVINIEQKSNCRQPLSKQCPPIVEHAVYNPARPRDWELFGSNMRSMKGTQVSVCNTNCNIQSATDSKLMCALPSGTDSHPQCDVQMVGTLEDYTGFIVKKKTKAVESGTQTDASSEHNASYASSRTWKIAVAIVAAIIIIALIIIITYCARRHYLKQRNMNKTSDDNSTTPFEGRFGAGGGSYRSHNTYHPGLDAYQMNRVSPYERIFREIDERLKIPNELLVKERKIGEGHFGEVDLNILSTASGEKRVACKSLRPGVAGVGEFMNEALMMDRFSHPRVMRLLGIAFSEDIMPIIVTEFMPNGDLLNFLRDANKTPTLRQLLQFAYQIADGMTYLHEHHFIHRDLAARNCMLDNQLNIKIADFGLCREVQSEDKEYFPVHKNRDLPLRWLPIEALSEETFTFKCDIWAYGVVLWELMTRGLTPYAGIKSIHLLDYLREGHRLSQPAYCPAMLYDEVMLACWAEDPMRRPTFPQLKGQVSSVVEYMEQAQRTQLNSHYEKVRGSTDRENVTVST